MKKNLLLASVILTMLVGLNACCTIVPGKVSYSPDLKGTIESVGAKIAILVTEKGEVLVYDEKGRGVTDEKSGLKTCSFPMPVSDPKVKNAKVREDSDAQYPPGVCSGLKKGSAITSLRTLSILKSNSEQCLILGVDGDGNPIQRCW